MAACWFSPVAAVATALPPELCELPDYRTGFDALLPDALARQ